MEVNQVAVMRRRKDSWLNATQILKVAGIEKGKRTKVLEKEILSGEHEKVQGGYGRYQGTWISYRRGVEFARQYGVEALLRPLFEYDMGQDGMTTAGQGNLDTPTKEQAMAAQRKRNMINGGADNRAPAQSPNGTFFKNISKSAANAVNAISKARIGSPSSLNRPAKPIRRPSQQMGNSQDSGYNGSSQQSMPSLHSENSFGSSQLDPALRAHNTPYYPNAHDPQNGDMNEPPRKRIRPSNSQDPFATDGNLDYDTSMRDLTPTDANESFAYGQGYSQPHMDYRLNGLQPLPQPTSKSAIEKQQILTNLFLDPNQTDFSNHPALLRLSGEDLDIPIDATAHTALHWAATLARTSLLRALIEKGSSIYRLNTGGETALIRAVLTTNNLDQGSFTDLLEMLGPTIEIRDGHGRTVLHHMAVASAIKGKSSACRYYLESLLEFVVRQGDASSSQQSSFQNPDLIMPAPKTITLVRFMSEIVNTLDMSGDTALNLAARIGNKNIIHQLLEVGADPTIANRGGLKPTDFGVGGDPDLLEAQQNSQVTRGGHHVVSKVAESSQELVACEFHQIFLENILTSMTAIKTLLSDTESSFRSEIQAKQSLIDQTHTKLRETTSLLNEERRRLAKLQRKSDDREALRQRIANLRRANDQQRAYLSSSSNGRSTTLPTEIRLDVKVGEADAGLVIDTTILPLSHDHSGPLHILPQQREYLATLPPTVILKARTTAYQKNNARLEAQAKKLHDQSSELETQLRKLVCLCLSLEEGQLDQLIGSLHAAVQSEGGEDVDLARVREFLRRVEGLGEE